MNKHNNPNNLNNNSNSPKSTVQSQEIKESVANKIKHQHSYPLSKTMMKSTKPQVTYSLIILMKRQKNKKITILGTLK
jgi:hypothetical protein